MSKLRETNIILQMLVHSILFIFTKQNIIGRVIKGTIRRIAHKKVKLGVDEKGKKNYDT